MFRCRHGLELAAARLRALSAEEVADRLDDRFRLLSRGDRTAAPRHRPLRAVIDWSWELLDEEEQALARRLTVFSGGATLAAAEAVCVLSGTAELLDSLVSKSLVESRDGRVKMSGTVRVYGARRLADAGGQERFRRAHAEYFLALAEEAEPDPRRAAQRRITELGSSLGPLFAQLAEWATDHLGSVERARHEYDNVAAPPESLFLNPVVHAGRSRGVRSRP
ncbi:hypothetical protein U9R90_19715 [Streptomyces sp. E11-3]|uniref:hypothetical protein n=1 Tax=Streptomyces sp. E11-3 TaxID=3110112 RepID=UPI003980978A